MFEILLSVSISCRDAKAIIARAKNHPDLPREVLVDITQQIKETVKETCNWDAND